MMLTSTFYTPPQQQYYSAYAPPRSSPLSERSVNSAPRLFNSSMASQESLKKSPTPQRAYKPNPLIQTRDAASKRRRDMFFQRVQNNREDKKWESRGEQIQQLDVVAERRRWEAEKARQAPSVNVDFEEEIYDETDLPTHAPQWEHDMTEAEYIAAQEEYELQQLIESMEQDDQENDTSSQHFGSDDEDYDALFMECAYTVDQQYQPSQQTPQESQIPSPFDNEDAMDTDMMDF